MAFFFEGVGRRDQTAMLWSAAITSAGVPLLLVGLRSWKRWPFILVFALIPWVLFGFVTLFNNEIIAGLLTAVVALLAAGLIRRFNIAR
ncbi:MAG: hypothetical protein M3041_02015 [Acidobacteriota bacterium]|nr:hypothetical protein [Acidobacteriota bacterium]